MTLTTDSIISSVLKAQYMAEISISISILMPSPKKHSLLKESLLGKFRSKIQNCSVKVKYGTQTNWNIQNSMVMFTVSVSEREISSEKIKIVCLGEIRYLGYLKEAEFDGNIHLFIF